jgi:hypothetical protein
MKSLASLRFLVAGAVVASAAPAVADTVVVAAADAPSRNGLVLGATIDGGNMGCQTKEGDDCGNGAHAAGGLSLHAGVMVTPNLAILAEAWGMAHEHDNLTATQVIATANLRAWIVPRLWLQGGLGVARSKLSYDDGILMGSDTSSTVPAVDLAVGVELIQSSQFGLDVELRGGSGLYRDDVRIWNAALGVGVSFF